MAIGDSYASVPEFKAYKKTPSAEGDLVLGRLLKAVSRLIDRRIEPFGFNRDEEPTTRVYGPGDYTAPIANLTGLVVKASAGRSVVWNDIDALVMDTDFEVLPHNPPAGEPWRDIKLFGWSSLPPAIFSPQTYLPDEWRVQVTAIHGWPSVPQEIWFGTIRMTAMLLDADPLATNIIQETDRAVEASGQARSLLKQLTESLNRYPIAVG